MAQSRVKHKRKENPIFHLQSKKEDNNALSWGMIKVVRKSGQLNLSNRSLTTVPEGIFTMYELKPDRDFLALEFDKNDDGDESWWSFTPLTYLDLSLNLLQELPSQIEMFQDLITLNIHDNNLISFPEELGKLKKLRKLNISRNQLKIWPKELCVFEDLECLLLSHNKIETISKATGDLVMLRQLDLSHNLLTKLPLGLGYLVRLTELNLSHNKLTKLPPDIVNIRGLLKLDVTHNDLKSLPNMGELRKLKILYAQHNDIEEFPNFEGCECIEELFFGNNFLKEIPVQFCENMPHLKVLDVRDNKIEMVPNEVMMITNLIRLDLTNNALTNVPSTLALLPHLQNLQITGNQLKSIRSDILKNGTIKILKHLKERMNEEELAILNNTNTRNVMPEIKIFPDKYAMKNSRTLHVTMKELTNLPHEVFEDALAAEVTAVDFCKNKFIEVPPGLSIIAANISELNLSFNQITVVPENLANCVKLKYLNLGNNLLITLPTSLESLVSLRELVVSNNRLSCIPECVYGMSGLEILLAQGNKITNIDVENLKQLKRIATLDLSNNDINHVPPELGNLTQLRTLEIKGNPFRQPRYAILEQGTLSILSYLRDRIPQ